MFLNYFDEKSALKCYLWLFSKLVFFPLKSNLKITSENKNFSLFFNLILIIFYTYCIIFYLPDYISYLSDPFLIFCVRIQFIVYIFLSLSMHLKNCLDVVFMTELLLGLCQSRIKLNFSCPKLKYNMFNSLVHFISSLFLIIVNFCLCSVYVVGIHGKMTMNCLFFYIILILFLTAEMSMTILKFMDTQLRFISTGLVEILNAKSIKNCHTKKIRLFMFIMYHLLKMKLKFSKIFSFQLLLLLAALILVIFVNLYFLCIYFKLFLSILSLEVFIEITNILTYSSIICSIIEITANLTCEVSY